MWWWMMNKKLTSSLPCVDLGFNWPSAVCSRSLSLANSGFLAATGDFWLAATGEARFLLAKTGEATLGLRRRLSVASVDIWVDLRPDRLCAKHNFLQRNNPKFYIFSYPWNMQGHPTHPVASGSEFKCFLRVDRLLQYIVLNFFIYN